MFYFCSSPVDLGDMETESVGSNSLVLQGSSQENNVSNLNLGLSFTTASASIDC